MTTTRLLARLVVATLLLVQEANGEEKVQPQPAQLGGLRNALATVSADESKPVYVIVAEMDSVHAFDDATNAELNRRQLGSIAHRALARYLSRAPIALTVTGEQSEMEIGEQRSRLTLRAPRAGVTYRPIPQPPQPDAEHQGNDSAKQALTALASVPPASGHGQLVLSSSLLSRSQEYHTLMEDLSQVWEGQLNYLLETNDCEAPPSSELASLAEKARGSARALSVAIRHDLLLLSTERHDLLKELKVRRRTLLKLIDAVPTREMQDARKE